MIGDRVAVQHFAPGDRRQALGVAADFEEGRADALLGEGAQDLRGRPGGRAVVEGEDHLVVGERDRLRISLEADLEAALDADFDDARRPELVGSTIRRPPGAHARKERRQRRRYPH